MAADEIHVNDVGLVLEGTITDSGAVDISSATLKQIWLESPSGSSTGYSAAFKTDGTDGIMQYTTIIGDLNSAGTWKIQGKVTISGKTFHSDVTTFTVHESLDT